MRAASTGYVESTINGRQLMAAQPFGPQPDRPCESLIGLAAPLVHCPGARSPEADRRRKLAVTDQLLTDIEELRLKAGHFLSAFLRDRVAAAEAEIIGTRRCGHIKSLRGAYELVLSLQGPLMAANPRNQPNPRFDSTVEMEVPQAFSTFRPLVPTINCSGAALPEASGAWQEQDVARMGRGERLLRYAANPSERKWRDGAKTNTVQVGRY